MNSISDEPTGRLALVFELMDMNLYEAIKGKLKIVNRLIGRPNYIPE